MFHAERSTLLNNINEIDSAILNKSESVVTRDESFKDEVNLLILNATIDFALSITYLMNHFIFSEFVSVFLFINNYMATTILQFYNF